MKLWEAEHKGRPPSMITIAYRKVRSYYFWYQIGNGKDYGYTNNARYVSRWIRTEDELYREI